MSGIYKIINKVNGKYYVGSSKNLTTRWREHKKLLRKGKHFNIHLQHSWNKHGEDVFVYEIIKYVPVEILLITEQDFLNLAKDNKDKVYNISFISGRVEMNVDTRMKISISNMGKRHSVETIRKIKNARKKQIHPMLGKKHTLEAIMKQRLKKLGRVGVLSSHYGKKHTEETKQKLREHFRGKCSHYDKTIYTFKNIETNALFVGNRRDFFKKYNLNPFKVGLVARGLRVTHKKWILVKD